MARLVACDLTSGWLAGLRKQAGWLGTPILLACVAVAQAQVPQRASVVELLRVLTATGVEVLYSSELVPATLEAPDALPQDDPLARVTAALAANHLVLQSTGARSYVVIRAPANSTTATAAVPAPVPPMARAPALEEISVFASRYEFSADAANESIGFDQREFEQMPGATVDPVRALRSAPGLATNLSARPYFRGAQRADVLVEYDGIALYDPFHFRDFQSILSVFNPATVSRADVFTGGFPAKYGTRSGAVLDLTPRSLESGSEYVISASLLSYDFATVGRSESSPVDWLLAARISSDDRVLQRLLSEEGEPSFYDVIGDIRWSADSSAVTVGWLLLRDEVTFDSPDEAAMGSSRDSSGWLRWDWTPSDALKSHTSLAATDSRRQNTGTLWLPGLAQGNLSAERAYSNIALQSDWTYSSAAAVWNFGGEFTHENANLQFLRQETLGASIASAFGRPLDVGSSSAQVPHAATLGLYSSAHRRWRTFEVEIGMRLDAQDYKGYGTRSQGSPRLNLRYDLSDRWHAYGSWGQFTQAERVDEYRTEANQMAPDSANRAQHSTIGITHDDADSIGWRLEGYRHHWSSISPYFDNALGPLSVVPQLEPDRVLVVPADADSVGLEISAQRTWARGVSAWGSYSFSRVTDDVSGREVLRSWDQEHAANLGFSWTKRGNAASVFFGWHSGWPRTPLAVIAATPSEPAYLQIGARNSSRWGSYFSADLRLSTSVPLPRGELSLWLDGTNVTNKVNDCCIDLDSSSPPGGPPVGEALGWMPRVINVGFTWRLRAGPAPAAMRY
jgi:hypothetical protein